MLGVTGGLKANCCTGANISSFRKTPRSEAMFSKRAVIQMIDNPVAGC
jgi:hypothetical protein